MGPNQERRVSVHRGAFPQNNLISTRGRPNSRAAGRGQRPAGQVKTSACARSFPATRLSEAALIFVHRIRVLAARRQALPSLSSLPPSTPSADEDGITETELSPHDRDRIVSGTGRYLQRLE